MALTHVMLSVAVTPAYTQMPLEGSSLSCEEQVSVVLSVNPLSLGMVELTVEVSKVNYNTSTYLSF